MSALDDAHTISLIAARAVTDVFTAANELEPRDHCVIVMDLDAAHKHVPMDLPRLLAADPFEFAHDLLGIWEHMNRDTGLLENCFLPRHSLPEGSR